MRAKPVPEECNQANAHTAFLTAYQGTVYRITIGRESLRCTLVPTSTPAEFNTPMPHQQSIMLTDMPGGVSQAEQEQHGLISPDIRFIIDPTHSPPFRYSF
jgi:hypothetical protein